MLEVGEGVDGRALRRWVELGLDTLGERCHEINTLNVFPVPDGDTGTNLLATLRAAADELGGPVDGALSVGAVAEALARGAFVGARGNSGVILAQGLRGVADSIAGLNTVDGRDFARALDRAATTVTGALSTPTEGTVVTVLRAAAGGAGRAVVDTKSLQIAVWAAADAAATALEDTTEQLDVLAAAGVVDAGGLGLLILLDCLVEIVSGQRPDRRLRLTSTPVTDAGGRDIADHAVVEHDGVSQDYEVMYIVDGSDRARIGMLRARLGELGDSVAIVSDGSAGWSVHVHCCDPGAAVEAGIAAGRLRRIAITGFALEAHRAGSCDRSAPVQRIPVPGSGRAVLAIVSGDGAAALFDAEGATVLSEETAADPRLLLDAIRSLPSADVLVLPNGWVPEQHIVAVGAQARDGYREVMFLPSSSMIQGLASLAVHDPGRATVDDAFAMSEAAAATRWGSLRYATERALTWVGTCEPGDSLGLAGRDVVVIEHDLVAAGVSLLDKILAAGGELVTMLVGDGAPDGLAEQLTRYLDDHHPELEVVVYQGGQRSDLLQLGVE
ncbi:DAK2 domain-containing protein [Rhodococcus sp. NPDC060086]|uniref:DAK2 domain-containing protein n=1 Tax=Rhodococcus sp. NPDC060086 TaxID=3347055 RepID=UPI003652836B